MCYGAVQKYLAIRPTLIIKAFLSWPSLECKGRSMAEFEHGFTIFCNDLQECFVNKIKKSRMMFLSTATLTVLKGYDLSTIYSHRPIHQFTQQQPIYTYNISEINLTSFNSFFYLPEPQTTKTKSARSHGPTATLSSALFFCRNQDCIYK